MFRVSRRLFLGSIFPKNIFSKQKQLPVTTWMHIILRCNSTMRSDDSFYDRLVCATSKIFRQILGSKNLSRQQRYLSLMRLCETNSGILQPILDYKFIAENEKAIQLSIDARRLIKIPKVKDLKKIYEEVKLFKEELDALELEKKDNSEKFNAMKTSRKPYGESKENEKLFQEMQERGRDIRERVRHSNRKFNEANDKLVEAILQLPNVLDDETPLTKRRLIQQHKSRDNIPQWEFQDYVAYHVSDYKPQGPCTLKSYQVPMFHSAEQEMQLSQLAQRHLIACGFSEAGLADTVRKSVLHSVGIDTDNILRLRECNTKRGDAHTSYITGASSLPSLLLLHSQSVVEDSGDFPHRYFVIGRSYYTNREGIAKHNCIVQCLVACQTESVMRVEFKHLTNSLETFYTDVVGVQKFQTQCIPAPNLAVYQRKKYVFVMNKTEKYPPKVLGDVSVIGDHLSKRLLCCYKAKDGTNKFIYFLHATFFDITNFLRANPIAKISGSEESKGVDNAHLPPPNV